MNLPALIFFLTEVAFHDSRIRLACIRYPLDARTYLPVLISIGDNALRASSDKLASCPGQFSARGI